MFLPNKCLIRCVPEKYNFAQKCLIGLGVSYFCGRKGISFYFPKMIYTFFGKNQIISAEAEGGGGGMTTYIFLIRMYPVKTKGEPKAGAGFLTTNYQPKSGANHICYKNATQGFSFKIKKIAPALRHVLSSINFLGRFLTKV